MGLLFRRKVTDNSELSMLCDDLIDGVHVWHGDLPVRFDEVSGLLWLHTSEQAKVDKNACGSTTHACGAVNIDVPAGFIDHFVEFAGRLVKSRDQIVLIKVMYREVDCLNSPLTVVREHARPVDTPVLMVNLCLHIEDTRHARLRHLVYVIFSLRIGSNEDVLFPNLLEAQITDKVRIALLDVAIDQEDVIHVAPLKYRAIVADLAERTQSQSHFLLVGLVQLWGLNVKLARRLSLPDGLVLLAIVD